MSTEEERWERHLEAKAAVGLPAWPESPRPALHPTPTRLRLLAAVERGDVHLYPDRRTWAGDGRELTARIAEAQRAGWVELGPEHPVKRPWSLTDESRRVWEAKR